MQADPQQLCRELAAYMHAKDEKNVRRVFRELLGSGFSREEILGKVLLILEAPPPQTLNGSHKPWSGKSHITVGSALGEEEQHPTGCSDISTKLAHSSDHKPFHRAAEEPPFRANFGQQSSQRGSRDNSQKAARASQTSPEAGVTPSNSARNSASNPRQVKTNTAAPRSAEQGTAGAGPATEPREAIDRIGIPSLPPDSGRRLSKSEDRATARSQSRKYTLSPGRASNGAAVNSVSQDAGPAISKPTRQIWAAPKTPEATVLPESGPPPTAPGGKAPSPQSSAKNDGEENVSMSPLDSIEAEKTGVKPEHTATADTKRTSDELEEALEALATVFTNNSPGHLPDRFETRDSTPERLALRLQPQPTKKSFGRRLIAEEARPTVATTPGAPSADAETATPQIGDASSSRSRSPKPRSRVLASAVRPMVAASILAAGVGGSYILWCSFGDQPEQAVMASVRNSATWLQHIRSNDWLAKVAAPVETMVASQQTEAAHVTNVPQNARNDEYTAPAVAHPTPEGSAPKPGEDSIASERDSQGIRNLGAPSTSSATELSPSPMPRGEPDTKSQLPQSNALNQTVNLNEIPPRKPVPPDAQTTVSSKTITQPAIPEQRNPGDGAPPIPGAPQARSIDVGALVSRGDQLLGMRDVTSARLFYERAAQAGDGHGALRMGMTFDPGFLDRSGIRGVQGDPVRAISWYNRAAALGNDAAEKLVNILTGRIK